MSQWHLAYLAWAWIEDKFGFMPHLYSSNSFGCQHKLEQPLGCSSSDLDSYAQIPGYVVV